MARDRQGRSFLGDRRSEVDRHERTPQVLIARGEISAQDKSLLTQLLGRFGLNTQYVSESTFAERESEVDKLKAEIELLRRQASSEVSSPKFRFTDITDPEQFLVREHLEDIRTKPGIGGFVGRTLHHLVDAHGSRPTHHWIVDDSRPAWRNNRYSRIYREPEPLEKVIVKLRDEIGLPPYGKTLDHYGKSAFCARFAVQAGSVVDAANAIQIPPDVPYPKLSAAERGVLFVGNMLEEQLK